MKTRFFVFLIFCVMMSSLGVNLSAQVITWWKIAAIDHPNNG